MRLIDLPPEILGEIFRYLSARQVHRLKLNRFLKHFVDWWAGIDRLLAGKTTLLVATTFDKLRSGTLVGRDELLTDCEGRRWGPALETRTSSLNEDVVASGVYKNSAKHGEWTTQRHGNCHEIDVRTFDNGKVTKGYIKRNGRLVWCKRNRLHSIVVYRGLPFVVYTKFEGGTWRWLTFPERPTSTFSVGPFKVRITNFDDENALRLYSTRHRHKLAKVSDKTRDRHLWWDEDEMRLDLSVQTNVRSTTPPENENDAKSKKKRRINVSISRNGRCLLRAKMGKTTASVGMWIGDVWRTTSLDLSPGCVV